MLHNCRGQNPIESVGNYTISRLIIIHAVEASLGATFKYYNYWTWIMARYIHKWYSAAAETQWPPAINIIATKI